MLPKQNLHQTGNQNSSIKKPKSSKPDNLKVFLACLPKKLTEQDIGKIFSTFGKIKNFSFDIKKQKKSKSHLINGILTCWDSSMKQAILNQSHFFNGSKLRVSNYLEKRELDSRKTSLKSRRVYIKKLPIEFDNKKLRDIFSPYGEIEDAYCTVGSRSRKNLKYGYVLFEDEANIARLPSDGILYRGARIDWETFYTRKIKKRRPMVGKKNLLVNDPERHLLKPGSQQYHLTFGEIWYSSSDIFFSARIRK